MKKIFILFLFTALCSLIQAQVATPPALTLKTPAGVTKSTIVKNDTVLGIYTAGGYYDITGAQVEVKRTTGKIGASSKVIFSGSLTGTTYFNIDTLVLTDVAAQSKVFSYTTSKYFYFKVWAKVDSTHTGTISTQYFVRTRGR